MYVTGRTVIFADKIRLCSMKDFDIQNERFRFSLLRFHTFSIWWSCFGWERVFAFIAKIVTKQKYGTLHGFYKGYQ